MPSQLDQTVSRCESILAQCLVAANQAAEAAASIGAAGLAPLQSPAFTGTPTAPTPPIGDSSTDIATTAFLARLLGVPSGIAQLDATGLIPVSQLPFSGLTFDGVWNAATNSPSLASSTGTAGHFRVVTVSGSTTLNGISTWNVGDQALFNGSVWQRVPFTAPPIVNLPLSSLAAQGSATIVGNISGGSASPSAITISSITSYLSTMIGATGSTTSVVGLVPVAGGTGLFLRSDGVWGSIGSPDLSPYALLASPAFTGTATAATQARNNMGSALATTQFVVNQQAGAGELALVQVNGTASAGTSTYGAKIDHIHGTDLSRAPVNYAGFSGFMWGLNCSNGTGAGVNTSINIAVGSAMDQTNAQMMGLGAILLKNLSTTWARGNGSGGFVSGESIPAIGGTIHVWLIAGANGTGVDVIANNHAISGLSPSLPPNILFKRRIMSLYIGNNSNQVTPFVQFGDQFTIAQTTTSSPGSPYSATLTTFPVPAGIVVNPSIVAQLVGSGSSAVLTAAPAANSSFVNSIGLAVSTSNLALCPVGPPTNTSQQIYTSLIGTGASAIIGGNGWYDTRGRIQ